MTVSMAGSTRRAVAGAVLFGMALLCWAFATPPQSSPDDDFHIANIYCLHDSSTCRSDDAAWPAGSVAWPEDPAARTGAQWDQLRKNYPDLWAYESPRRLPCFNTVLTDGRARFAQRTPEPADCLNTEDPATNRPATVDRLDYYPQGAYRIYSLFTAGTIRDSVAVWRIATVLLVIVLAALSLRLSLPRWRQSLLFAWLVCAVPYGAFLFASHSPSALAAASAMASVGPALAVAERQRADRAALARGAFIACCLVVAATSRREAILWLVGSAIVVLFLAFASRANVRILSIGLGVGVLLVAAGFATGLLGGAMQRFIDSYAYGTQHVSLWQAINDVPHALLVFDEPLGWLDIPMPNSVLVLGCAAMFGLLTLGLAQFNGRKAAAIAAAVLLLLGTLIVIQLRSDELVQARYYLPMVFLIVVAFLAPTAGRALPAWSKAQWLGISGCLVAANAIALATATLRYVTGVNDVSPVGLATTPQWWWGSWLGPLANLIVGAALFAAALAVVLPLCRVWTEATAPTSPRQGPDRGSALDRVDPPLHTAPGEGTDLPQALVG